jgi:hypothetical protein
LEPLDELSREELIQIITELRQLNQRLQAEIEQLKRRGGAAPFSKGKPKQDPKPPGRKSGQGYFRFRAAPDAVTASAPTDVPINEPCCPNCGGELGQPQRDSFRRQTLRNTHGLKSGDVRWRSDNAGGAEAKCADSIPESLPGSTERRRIGSARA